MIDGMKVLAVIPARGGSKGIPGKNILQVGGKPLIAWTIEEAKKSKFIDRLIVSSDDKEIIRVARAYNCDAPFERPAELARDETPGVEPILHALQELPGYDFVVMLQPTSPLRRVEDIDGCIEMCLKKHAKACVSVTKASKHPFWMYQLDEECRMMPFSKTDKQYLRRQDLPEVYALNGAVYVAEKAWLYVTRNFLTPETLGYEMPPERSFDIDTAFDLKIVRHLLEQER